MLCLAVDWLWGEDDFHSLTHTPLQLHAAVVELSTAKDAEIKYSTVQNWCVRFGLVVFAFSQ